jgi:hypothetical protein
MLRPISRTAKTVNVLPTAHRQPAITPRLPANQSLYRAEVSVDADKSALDSACGKPDYQVDITHEWAGSMVFASERSLPARKFK